MISLIHPSRSRAQKSFETIKKWLDRSVTDIEVIVSIDNNDPHVNEYLHNYSTVRNANVIIGNNRSAIDAINKGAGSSTGNILIVVSDDTDCPNRWDEVIQNAVKDKEDFVLRVGDGIQKWICTMPIMDRVYYNRFGYVYYPEFRHMFCDTLITHVADVTKKIIWRDDIVFPHLHYSIKKSEKDQISQRADETVNEGKRIYLEMVKNNFSNLGLSGIDIWNLDQRAHSSGHVQWLKHHLQ